MKTGADDYLVAHGLEVFRELLGMAWAYDPSFDDAGAEIAWQARDLTPETPTSEKLLVLDRLVPTLAFLSNMRVAAVLEELRESLRLRPTDLSDLKRDIKEARKARQSRAQARRLNNTPEAAYTAILPDLVDLVEHEGAPAFLLLTENGVELAPEREHDGILYFPPPREQIPWLLPRGAEVLKWYSLKETPGALYDDLLAYHQGVSELPGEAYYDLITAWDFHTYLLEHCQYSPEICLFAVPERGKSRTGKGMIYVARRGVHVESLRDAYLVRLADNFEATIFFDVMNLWKKAEKMGCEDIILGRFERGIVVPRVLYPERGPHQDTVYFKIFGPTIIATNVQVHNILDTRAVQLNMPHTSKRFEADVTPETALVLKERLTAWRAHYLGEDVPDIPKPAAGRLGDITKPLLQTIHLVRPERVPMFLSLIGELERSRLIDKSDSLEAQILLVLDSLQGQVVKGILPVKLITDTFNEVKAESAQFTYQRMGRSLASLGFEKGKTGDGASAILWDEEKLMRIFSSYGLEKTSEIPETSETPEKSLTDSPDVSDQSDVSDVLSHTRPGKKSHPFFSNNIRPMTRPLPFMWDQERQRQAADRVREGDRDLWEGEI